MTRQIKKYTKEEKDGLVTRLFPPAEAAALMLLRKKLQAILVENEED